MHRASSTKSYVITAEVEIPQGGAEVMLATLVGRFGGFGLYLLKGKPVFTYNLLGLERFRWESQAALSPAPVRRSNGSPQWPSSTPCRQSFDSRPVRRGRWLDEGLWQEPY